MIKYLSILVFIFLYINSFSQKVVIKGNAPGAEGKTLEVIAYSDQVTYLEHKVASTFIDDKGNFILDGYGKEVNVSDIEKGKYWVNYDNRTEVISKK